jgi:hypothetical protein
MSAQDLSTFPDLPDVLRERAPLPTRKIHFPQLFQCDGAADPSPLGELDRIQRRLDGFNWPKSRAWAHLSCQFGPRLNQEELVSIAELVGNYLGIRLDRDARRRKIVMIKWFEEHWTAIQPILRIVVLAADPA